MQFGLRDWAQRDPERLAVRMGDGSQSTYADIETLANRIAHFLRSVGLRKGDHVALLLSNGPLILATVWAAYRAGLYLTPIPSGASAAEAAYIVRDCQAQVMILDAKYKDLATSLQAMVERPVKWVAANGELDGFASLEREAFQLPVTPIPDEQPGGLMMYSSGTTGAPKGIWRPLPTLEQVGSGAPTFARDLLSLFEIVADAHYLSTSPLYHAAPLRFALAFLAAGGRVTVMDRFDAAEALRLLVDEKITHSLWVPTMFQRLLSLPDAQRRAFEASHHRYAIHGAAPCAGVVKRAMIEWWGPILHEYYSGSEGVGLCSITSEEWLRKPGSVGKARKGNLHILDEGDRPAGKEVTGRIYFSGTAPFQYFNAPEKTAAKTSAQGYQTFGDIGYVDADGYLFLRDRQDDMIISGGVNIYPQEIESALLELPEIADCAVAGFPDPDFGEKAVAFIQVRASLSDMEAQQFLEKVREFGKKRLGRMKQPKEIRLVQSLPRTPTGKLLRRQLRDQGE